MPRAGVPFAPPSACHWTDVSYMSVTILWNMLQLRLLYECIPMAYIIEQAGGLATTGSSPILDVIPNSIHQRSPVFLGSKEDVEDVIECFKKYVHVIWGWVCFSQGICCGDIRTLLSLGLQEKPCFSLGREVSWKSLESRKSCLEFINSTSHSRTLLMLQFVGSRFRGLAVCNLYRWRCHIRNVDLSNVGIYCLIFSWLVFEAVLQLSWILFVVACFVFRNHLAKP